MLLAGVTSSESEQASAPTNVHLISGEVSGSSEDGVAMVAIDGLIFSEADDQYVEMDTLGGLEDGDIVTIILSGETGGGMTPLAIGGSGTIDRISLRVKDIEADYIKAEELEAVVARFDTLDATYAQIDGANITSETVKNSWIDNLMVQTGLIANDGTVYTLDAIKVNASNITAGTIDVERLIVTVNNEKYLVHIDPNTSQPVYQKLDGGVIEDLTITADKIVAGAITADKITTNNLVGTGGWINLRNGTFSYANATTGAGISWDGSHLTIGAGAQIGDATAEEVASMASQLQYDHTYTYNSSTETYTFTASVYKSGVDVTNQFGDEFFVWYLKTEQDTTLLGHGKTMTVQASAALYTGTVIGGLEDSVDYMIIDSFDFGIQTAGGDDILARVNAREV